MTPAEAQAQAVAYRNAAASHRANGDEFVATQLEELANRIDANLRAMGPEVITIQRLATTEPKCTLDYVMKASRAHGFTDQDVICRGKHTVELREGHCTIARDELTGLCSLRDLKEALGY